MSLNTTALHSGSKLARWNVQASSGALNTSNPIREIIETMNLAENPNKKLIPLSIGDPTIFGNLKPCQETLDALHRALACGKFYGYQTAAGMEAAREAVADYHHRCTGSKVKHQDVILASGCSHAIDLSICVLARPGQNILIPRPGFPLYKTLTSVYGVHYKQYNLLADKNWSIDLEHLESLIDENTAAIVVNNPSNPCGSVFSRHHLEQILELAERHKKPIIADEIYDKLVFPSYLYRQGKKRPQFNNTHRVSLVNVGKTKSGNAENREPSQDYSKLSSSSSASSEDDSAEDSRSDDAYENFVDISAYDEEDSELSEQSSSSSLSLQNEEDGQLAYVPFMALSSLSKTVPILTCGGISKTCLIPGLRLGWIIINDRQSIFDASVRNGLNRLTQRLMGPNSLVQGALPDILTKVSETFYTQTMEFVFKNAKLCYERLKQVKGLQPYMPQGSMYLMVRFEPKLFPNIDGDLDFTSKLMNEESVLVLPGKCFDFPNYFRLCLTVPTNVMDEALDRMRDFCERHCMVAVNQIKLADKSSTKFTSSMSVQATNFTTTTTTTTTTNSQIQQKSNETTTSRMKLQTTKTKALRASKC